VLGVLGQSTATEAGEPAVEKDTSNKVPTAMMLLVIGSMLIIIAASIDNPVWLKFALIIGGAAANITAGVRLLSKRNAVPGSQ
jgi:hypothetical protein